MPLRSLRLTLAAVALAALPAAPAAAQKAEFVPKPDTYICPNAASPGAVDCFLNAVEHLYTMCRHIKSIEVIEFGYEKAEEGVNGAKTAYCVDKHKLSMTRPYQAALREASPSRTAVDSLRALHDLWLKALVALKWTPGESDDQYKARVAEPYPVFRERAESVRADLVAAKTKVAAPAAKPKAAVAAAPKAAN